MSRFNLDDEFDDYQEVFDDVADDWQQEAEMEQRQAAAEAAAQAQRKENKLNTRAPVTKNDTVDQQVEALPEQVQRQLQILRQQANSVMATSDFIGDSSSEKKVLFDTVVDNKEQAIGLGTAIANRVLQFYARQNYDDLICTIFDNISHDFDDEKLINKQLTKTHVLSQQMKRTQKSNKKRKELDIIQGNDALGFDSVNDQGGAAAVDDDQSPF